jgi:hypothetical protein
MPRWASRITLEITGVKVERLQEISEEDAVAEGFEASSIRWWQGFERHEDGSRHMIEGGASPDGPPPEWMESPELQVMTRSARSEFESHWRHINSSASWDLNPWVWAVSFRRIGT